MTTILTQTGRRVPAPNGAELGKPVYDIGVYIGRFQFFHNGHLFVIREGLRHVSVLAILIGSSNTPRDYFNPMTFEERRDYIMASLTPEERERVICLPLEDFTYNNTRWITQAMQQASVAAKQFGLDGTRSFALVGHEKDGTGFYLKMFQQWDSINVPNFQGLSATPFRERFFLTDEPFYTEEMPQPVIDFLDAFEKTPAFAAIEAEYRFVEKYREPYKNLPYPPIFVTVDAVVIQGGNILMIERGGYPGKGLWALPGGYLNAHERIEDAVYRELREETMIAVPEPVLRGSTEAWDVFDSVHRDPRGRTITHAALINLKGDRLPKIKGNDDAKKAKWFPLEGNGALQRNETFSDHYAIIAAMVAKL